METPLIVPGRIRRNFGKVKPPIDVPYLIALPKQSYAEFLQMDVGAGARKDKGIQAALKEVFPIKDFTGSAELEFVDYEILPPEYSPEECREKGLTYEALMKLRVRLITYDVDPESETRNIRDIKEQEIFFGTVPLMTDDGRFIVNGTERVVVNQLQRSAGVFFAHDKGKAHAGKIVYTARIIPVRGSWLDFEYDHRGRLLARIDRRKNFTATTFLKAMGLTEEEILNYFYPREKFLIYPDRIEKEINPEVFLTQKVSLDIVHPETGEVILKKGRKVTKAALRKLQEAGLRSVPVLEEDFIGRIAARDVVDPETGEVIVACNEEITREKLEKLRKLEIREVECLYIDIHRYTRALRDTLKQDKVKTREEALIEIYKKMRPSSPATIEVAEPYFRSLFFDPETYDLSEVGRYKINLRLGLDIPITQRVLTKEDVLAILKELIRLKETQGEGDDIDHLGNRRVRAVGELVENQYRVGLVRMERAVKERMTLQDVEALMPNDLINPKPVSAALKEFFAQGQLSQFMDQTNPLSMITHKRRLSALGPGGLTRERAGFEVRDVHPSHYGRICPIETPEGPNIGLIVSMATYARANPYGFLETPYRLVKKGKVTDQVIYLNAAEEKDLVIAQSTIRIDKDGQILDEVVPARQGSEFVMARREEVDLVDLVPAQVVSVSSSLIPFLEHDDANRALMGSNMQRQAVPLIKTEAPLVGSGMEKIAARDSGMVILAERDGVVEDVDATRIVVRYEGQNGEFPEVKIYSLMKWRRSNQNTTFNQKPRVRPGQRVRKGEVLADGPSTDRGELALGRNVLVAFMPWRGYNFEDSIVISERLVRDDVYTSIHIEEFECVARETKLGREEITRDIPNVSEEALANLDESGIVKIGAYVRPGDILVGKVTPKGEVQLTPEEKLLRAIFGEKASDVKDTSLRVPAGIEGIVIDTKVFTRRGVEKDARALQKEAEKKARLDKDEADYIEILRRSTLKILEEILVGEKAAATLKNEDGEEVIARGATITKEVLEQISLNRLREIAPKKVKATVDDILKNFEVRVAQIKHEFERRRARLTKGDELPPGVLKVVKVYVAMKRKLQPGDKMAGRHGNKGVISKVVPIEDMPYMPDGTPVDMILSPLGVPSRMNIGQILETHMGWACKEIGRKLARLAERHQVEAVKDLLKKLFSPEEYEELIQGKSDEEILDMAMAFAEGLPIATPVFDGAKEPQIKEWLREAGLSETGQTVLYNGLTGEPFREPVTVGYMYMLKLHHLVDDKIHARATGPYSLITQQPLGGKAQFGGQRLGEMEVWAMEAYGAAYALQEFLTVKSDDVTGRTRMYEKIVKGDNFLEPGLPESFKVLVKELQGLCLDVETIEE
ncbi:DNA-directed RNA polymerase subunit beta [Thermosulfurimonas dismutans]|uniref:DNA-directed RNA polymerase subunit beta n=1 Tax=Thermosulfurimonas dismutans TaxID=999894 RepID=A0A179D1N5_9BACT|nr:DNA-directed RNA polymerase subunit beta [Thermosulfurimonas dismutans]OAQ19985.1 DNA-directed RNA polymerase beta subunit [Thermosulfurimonas dismutans]